MFKEYFTAFDALYQNGSKICDTTYFRETTECILTVLVRKEIGLILINCVKYAKGIAPITADVNLLSL